MQQNRRRFLMNDPTESVSAFTLPLTLHQSSFKLTLSRLSLPFSMSKWVI